MSDFQAGPAPQQPHQPQPPQYQQQYQAPAPPQGPPVPHIAAPRHGLLTSSRRHWFFALITAAVLLLWYVGFRVLLRNGALSGNLYLPYIWTTNTIFLVGGYFFGAAIATAFVLRVIALSNGSLQHNHYLSSRSFLYGFSALIFLGTDFIFPLFIICLDDGYIIWHSISRITVLVRIVQYVGYHTTDLCHSHRFLRGSLTQRLYSLIPRPCGTAVSWRLLIFSTAPLTFHIE